MKINLFFNRIRNLIADPQKEFARIEAERKQPRRIYMEFILPLVIITAIASYFGKVLFGPVTMSLGTGVALKAVFMLVTIQVIGVYVSALIINELFPLFHAQKKFNKTFAIISYSALPAYLALIFAGLLPTLANVIYLAGIYSVVLYWHAVQHIADMVIERRQVFVPFSIFVIVLFYLLFRVIMGIILSF